MNTNNLIGLLRNIKINYFKKGVVLINMGAVNKDVLFIRKGIVRSYLINEKGEEVTFQLYAENNVFGNVHNILFNEKSRFCYQALEDLKVYVISYEFLMNINASNSEIFKSCRTYFIKKIIQQAFNCIEDFVFLSPEERYLKFIEYNPKLIHRVQDKYIANVLGITPVSLSRIRKRISKRV